MSAKKRLGKGLDSLISPRSASASPAPEPQRDLPESATEIALSRMVPNPKQPRVAFDEGQIEALAESIRRHGMLQPILVRPRGDEYEIVAGERRFRAAKAAGLETVPTIVRELDDDDMLLFALIENLQREDLDPIEKAQAFLRLVRELKLSHEEVGAHVGISRTAVTNTIRLLELEPELQQMVARGDLSAGHARALLALKEREQRLQVARTVIEGGLSVREMERLVYGSQDEPGSGSADLHTASGSSGAAQSPHVTDMEEQLQEALGTKVTIQKRRKGGRIAIQFYDNDDFERLFSLLVSKTML